MFDWWNITPTANVAELADLVIAGVGVSVSLGNLAAARQRAGEWAASGRNGAVLLSARTAVRHESLRVGTHVAFLALVLSTLRTRVPLTPEIAVFHASLMAAMTCVMLMSVSSWRSRRRLETLIAGQEEGHD